MSVTIYMPKAPSNAPSVNFANVNARAVLEVMGVFDPYLCGSLAPHEIPAVIRRVIRALNVTRARVGMLREAVGGLGDRFVDFGSDDEDARRRLAGTLEVLRFASANGWAISWD